MAVTDPNYLRIANHYAEQIEAGRLAAGALLPPLPRMMEDWGVSKGTITRAYEELESRGMVQRQQGRGTVVLPSDRHRAPVTLESLAARVAQLEADRDRLAAEVQALRGQRP